MLLDLRSRSFLLKLPEPGPAHVITPQQEEALLPRYRGVIALPYVLRQAWKKSSTAGKHSRPYSQRNDTAKMVASRFLASQCAAACIPSPSSPHQQIDAHAHAHEEAILLCAPFRSGRHIATGSVKAFQVSQVSRIHKETGSVHTLQISRGRRWPAGIIVRCGETPAAAALLPEHAQGVCTRRPLEIGRGLAGGQILATAPGCQSLHACTVPCCEHA